jgi:hypothetical protein
VSRTRGLRARGKLEVPFGAAARVDATNAMLETTRERSYHLLTEPGVGYRLAAE